MRNDMTHEGRCSSPLGAGPSPGSLPCGGSAPHSTGRRMWLKAPLSQHPQSGLDKGVASHVARGPEGCRASSVRGKVARMKQVLASYSSAGRHSVNRPVGIQCRTITAG